MKKDFFISNRERLAGQLKDNSMLLLFAGEAPHKSADENYRFTPNRNFYYITGIDKPKAVFMLEKANEKCTETLFIEKNDPVMEKWVGRKISAEEAKELSGIDSIKYLDELQAAFSSVHVKKEIKYLYLDMERREWDMPQSSAQHFAEEAGKRYPHLKIKDAYHKISKLRTIKTDEEVGQIKKAIAITKDGILSMMKNVKPGMYENEVEAYFDFELKRAGTKDFAFHSIIGSGVNGTTLHYEDNCCKIDDNSLVLTDVGAQFEYYNADITRTFPAGGRFTERQKELYNIVLKAQLETMKFIKAGVPFGDINERTKKVLAEECRRIGLIKEDSELQKYYFHGVSHHLGLDTHDVGSREAVLEKGMVLTVEPGLYVEEEGIGIRIEDDVLVTEDGCINLSPDIIKTVEEIEEFMKNR